MSWAQVLTLARYSFYYLLSFHYFIIEKIYLFIIDVLINGIRHIFMNSCGLNTITRKKNSIPVLIKFQMNEKKTLSTFFLQQKQTNEKIEHTAETNTKKNANSWFDHEIFIIQFKFTKACGFFLLSTVKLTWSFDWTIYF